MIQDNDTAITGADSMGGVELPDSSRVLLGANTRVQVGAFNQTDVANASFVILSGHVRFSVQHPKGSKANYTFKTPTAQIAVRGTVGDIEVTPDTLQVNVYQSSDPSLPVNVTLGNGQVFTLHAGQSLIMHFGMLVAGGSQAAVQAVSNSVYQPFAEFGLPANAAAVGLAPVIVAHFALLPLLTAVVVDTALLTTTSHTTTSTVAGPNNTTVPVHVQIVSFPIHLPFIP